MKYIIVDIDGTIASHEGIRGHHEYDKVRLDKPIPATIDLINALSDSYNIIYLTGRPESCRASTELWIGENIKFKEETFTLTMGEFLTLEFLEPMNLSQNELARNIGVPSSRINAIIKGKAKITLDTDMRLCIFFEKTEGFFLRIQEDLDRREHISGLYMRTTKDHRKDYIVKKELLYRFMDDAKITKDDISFVIDDRLSVIDMWISEGLFVFNVNNGKGEF